MKRILFVGIAFMTMQICSSCSKEETNPQQSEPENKSEYYVKFEANCIGSYSHLNDILYAQAMAVTAPPIISENHFLKHSVLYQKVPRRLSLYFQLAQVQIM